MIKEKPVTNHCHYNKDSQPNVAEVTLQKKFSTISADTPDWDWGRFFGLRFRYWVNYLL